MEDYIYKPEELLFTMMVGLEEEGLPNCVAFTVTEYWNKNQCCSDDLGGHNMPAELLLECGVADGELMESIFELTGQFPLEEVKQRLLAAGFTQDHLFTEFMKHDA